VLEIVVKLIYKLTELHKVRIFIIKTL